ncbi:MAG: nicotinate (nicotinamide) nucleotide adenylyltransferase [Oscillospiraceae bacterium]|jgi:nicotinate-nucleotide adenylyltransferase|nr:nicotinate (nicotinamide) nucleotide adenylyltransferase [Oscillospiraceae bacterium]
MKIGVFGGTFNPIHNSHIYLAREYERQLGLDRVVIVPSFIPPHKEAENLADGQDRLNMCRLATKAMPLFHVTDFEVKNEGKSYTFRTLRHIADKYPGSELYLIMGADMFLTVQDWRLAPEIFRLATLCGAQREKGELTTLDIHKQVLENKGARCVIIDIEAKPLSSTQVRDMIAEGRDASNLLHPEVLTYIVSHGLYFG